MAVFACLEVAWVVLPINGSFTAVVLDGQHLFVLPKIKKALKWGFSYFILITKMNYPIEILLNSVTVNPLLTLSRYWAIVRELSFTNAWLSKVFSL